MQRVHCRGPVTCRPGSQWVVALPGLGALAMFAVMLFGWAQTRSSAELLLRGEGDQLLERLQHTLREGGEFLSNEVLQRALTDIDPAGVRYLAMVLPDGEILASAGTQPTGFSDARLLRPGEPLRRGALAWIFSRPLPGPGFGPPPGK